MSAERNLRTKKNNNIKRQDHKCKNAKELSLKIKVSTIFIESIYVMVFEN